jgi:hypothetical protein
VAWAGLAASSQHVAIDIPVTAAAARLVKPGRRGDLVGHVLLLSWPPSTSATRSSIVACATAMMVALGVGNRVAVASPAKARRLAEKVRLAVEAATSWMKAIRDLETTHC